MKYLLLVVFLAGCDPAVPLYMADATPIHYKACKKATGFWSCVITARFETHEMCEEYKARFSKADGIETSDNCY